MTRSRILVIVTLGSLIYAIIEGARTDWRELGIRSLFGLAGVTFVALVLWELRRKDPLIDPRCFRSLPFTGAVLTGVCSFGSLGGFLFLATIYLQDARGLSALHAGLHMLPTAAAMAVCPLLAARLVARRDRGIESHPQLQCDTIAALHLRGHALSFLLDVQRRQAGTKSVVLQRSR